MNAAEEQDELLGTSTLRGILLLGGVSVVAYLAWKYWKRTRVADLSSPHKTQVVRIPIELPLTKRKA